MYTLYANVLIDWHHMNCLTFCTDNTAEVNGLKNPDNLIVRIMQ